MKITEVTVSISRTFNLGSYESCRVEASASASLENETPENVAEKLVPHFRKMMITAYQDHIDGKGKGKDFP